MAPFAFWCCCLLPPPLGGGVVPPLVWNQKSIQYFFLKERKGKERKTKSSGAPSSSFGWCCFPILLWCGVGKVVVLLPLLGGAPFPLSPFGRRCCPVLLWCGWCFFPSWVVLITIMNFEYPQKMNKTNKGDPQGGEKAAAPKRKTAPRQRRMGQQHRLKRKSAESSTIQGGGENHRFTIAFVLLWAGAALSSPPL